MQFMNVDNKLIGKRIKEARVSMGITQEILAERLEVTTGYVSQVERGITKISLDLLANISFVLNKDISVFVTGSSTKFENYMLDSMALKFSQLNRRDKRIVMEIVEMMLDNE